MSNPQTSTKLSTDKIRLVEDDEEDNPIDMNDDGDNSIGNDDEEVNDTDDDDDVDEDDDIIDEEDDIDINSDDDMDNALDTVQVPSSSKIAPKSKKVTGIQSMNTPVPPQFFNTNDDDNETEDDGDMVVGSPGTELEFAL